MQPRGQLWFELEKVCNDFVDFSGLSRAESLGILISVLGNMLEAMQQALDDAKAGKLPDQG